MRKKGKPKSKTRKSFDFDGFNMTLWKEKRLLKDMRTPYHWEKVEEPTHKLKKLMSGNSFNGQNIYYTDSSNRIYKKEVDNFAYDGETVSWTVKVFELPDGTYTTDSFVACSLDSH